MLHYIVLICRYIFRLCSVSIQSEWVAELFLIDRHPEYDVEPEFLLQILNSNKYVLVETEY